MTRPYFSLVALAIMTHAGSALAEPALPTQTAPVADASRRISAAYSEVSTGLTPKGAKRGLAIAAARIGRGYHHFLGVVQAPGAER